MSRNFHQWEQNLWWYHLGNFFIIDMFLGTLHQEAKAGMNQSMCRCLWVVGWEWESWHQCSLCVIDSKKALGKGRGVFYFFVSQGYKDISVLPKQMSWLCSRRNHRILEWFVLEGMVKIIFGQGLFPLDWVAQSPVHPRCLEHFKGWDILWATCGNVSPPSQ